ncbi:Pleckstrin homology domain-containing protein [Phyllosticta capitalensis]|uniref:Pleckstrin homology domain-containing protein n=1 Tax=Phyllosticta capitalensis TaxID=121624 RepID=UPI00312F1B70
MDPSHDLPPDSYTAQRLQHATPEHLYLTSRRCFIGPIPEGWLKSHRRDWYKRHFHINYSSRAATFSAGETLSFGRRRTTGLDASSSASGAAFKSSFPQPRDVTHNVDGGAAEDGDEQTTSGPAIVVPRAQQADGEIVSEELEGRTRSPTSNSLAPRDNTRRKKGRPSKRRESTGSFVTASEIPSADMSPRPMSPAPPMSPVPRVSNGESSLQVPPSSPGGAASTSSLLPRANQNGAVDAGRGPVAGSGREGRASGRGVKFSFPNPSKRAEIQAKARLIQAPTRRLTRLRRSKIQQGIIVKMDKMLVRVDSTLEQLGDDFDENAGHRIESRTTEKWREYMVVCREMHDEDSGADFVLQLYKTRVIPAVEGAKTRKKAKYEIPLTKRISQVNLYSSLDKTVVVWTPSRKGTKIYLIRPRSGHSAVEWFTFLRKLLGWQRASELQINVPDLKVQLRLTNPFQELEGSEEVAKAAEGNEEAIAKAEQEEQAVARNIIKRSLDLLAKSKEYGAVAQEWAERERIGLAWKRYDRLEWVHGANEKKMYGSLAMSKTHDLELRPKSHYSTTAKTKKDNILTEPVPVEGFLIRLTSQRGVDKRLGKMFFKRLYFSTHDNFFIFSRPARASPPPPPHFPNANGTNVPSAKMISESIPLIYAVNPYPLKDGEIEWLSGDNPIGQAALTHHDRDAEDESKRKDDLLLKSDGYINLCNVKKVRKVHRGAAAADENVEEGSDVDFDMDVSDSMEDDGVTGEFDDQRTFELVLRNGLVIRLQAFDKETKKEWMHRLRALVKYWKHRSTADITAYKTTRSTNLALLNIDEEAEAFVGQYASKWEVSHTHASPQLYHLCAIAQCRAIRMAGVLYRKPRRHATFSRCAVVLADSHLLIFQDSLRKATGKQLHHIHHEHIASIDLSGDSTYLYAGLLTENDLLYRNRTFDSSKPGSSALPRIYLEDGWTSTDDDAMTCFVLWQGRKRSLFRRAAAASSSSATTGGGAGPNRTATSTSAISATSANSSSSSPKQKSGTGGGRFKLVSQLGVPGSAVVFKARSRAERDHWVLAIQTEIDRLVELRERETDGRGAGEEVRIVGGEGV